MSQWLSTFHHDDTTYLVWRAWVKASYPRYADTVISFDERLSEIKNESIRNVLHTIMLHIEKEYIPWVNDKRDINFVEEDLVNYTQMFLYWLAELYKISSVSQRRDMIELLISWKIWYIEYL